jgi:hypothetical protein
MVFGAWTKAIEPAAASEDLLRAGRIVAADIDEGARAPTFCRPLSTSSQ